MRRHGERKAFAERHSGYNIKRAFNGLNTFASSEDFKWKRL